MVAALQLAVVVCIASDFALHSADPWSDVGLAAMAFAPGVACGYASLSERGGLLAFWFPTALWSLAILDGADGTALAGAWSWVLLTVLAAVAYIATYGQHVTWQRYMQHEMDTNPKAQERMAQVPADQRAQSMETGAKIAGIAAVASVVVITPLVPLIWGAIVLAIVNSMSAGLKFKQVFSIMAYAGLPAIVKAALSIVVMFLKNPDDFNLRNPLAFNPAAFMDPVNGSKFLYSLGTSVDLFAIWIILLAATGVKMAAGKRLSFGSALTAVVVPWAFFVLLGAGAAGIFS